jgi:hypothetical protein
VRLKLYFDDKSALGDHRQYEALQAFYMDGLSSSAKVRGPPDYDSIFNNRWPDFHGTELT